MDHISQLGITLEVLGAAKIGAIVCGIVGGVKGRGGAFCSILGAAFWAALGAVIFGCAVFGLNLWLVYLHAQGYI